MYIIISHIIDIHVHRFMYYVDLVLTLSITVFIYPFKNTTHTCNSHLYKGVSKLRGWPDFFDKTKLQYAVIILYRVNKITSDLKTRLIGRYKIHPSNR